MVSLRFSRELSTINCALYAAVLASIYDYQQCKEMGCPTEP